MNNLREIRKSKKLTMKQLGEMVGVTESMIGQIETNKRNPSYETLLKLGEALECSVADITQKNPVTTMDDGNEEVDSAVSDLIMKLKVAPASVRNAAVAAALAVLNSDLLRE